MKALLKMFLVILGMVFASGSAIGAIIGDGQNDPYPPTQGGNYSEVLVYVYMYRDYFVEWTDGSDYGPAAEALIDAYYQDLGVSGAEIDGDFYQYTVPCLSAEPGDDGVIIRLDLDVDDYYGNQLDQLVDSDPTQSFEVYWVGYDTVNTPNPPSWGTKNSVSSPYSSTNAFCTKSATGGYLSGGGTQLKNNPNCPAPGNVSDEKTVNGIEFGHPILARLYISGDYFVGQPSSGTWEGYVGTSCYLYGCSMFSIGYGLSGSHQTTLKSGWNNKTNESEYINDVTWNLGQRGFGPNQWSVNTNPTPPATAIIGSGRFWQGEHPVGTFIGGPVTDHEEFCNPKQNGPSGHGQTWYACPLLDNEAVHLIGDAFYDNEMLGAEYCPFHSYTQNGRTYPVWLVFGTGNFVDYNREKWDDLVDYDPVGSIWYYWEVWNEYPPRVQRYRVKHEWKPRTLPSTFSLTVGDLTHSFSSLIPANGYPTVSGYPLYHWQNSKVPLVFPFPYTYPWSTAKSNDQFHKHKTISGGQIINDLNIFYDYCNIYIY